MSAAGRPIRIAHVVCTDAFAGVERYIADVARAQAASGAAVVVIGGAPAAMAPALAGSGVSWRPGAGPLAAARSLARVATGRWGLRPDVVHAHLTAAEAVAVALRPVHRAPVVATLHLALPRGGHRPRARAYAVLARAIDAEVAISTRVAEASGGAPVVVRSGVPVPDTAPLDAAERPPVVLVAQRLEAEKGVDVVADAWAASGLAADGWRLDVVGDGSRRAWLEDRIAALGLTRSVRFLGTVPDARPLLAGAAILLAPTPDEGLGLTVLEAMAAGTPVVSAAAGGHLETAVAVDPTWHFPPGDAAGAGSVLRRLALDPDRRAAYGRDLAAGHAERFTVERHVAGLDAVYAPVIARV